MPYDPSLPAPNSPLESQVIRDQLQALFVLIQNIASVSSAVVDSVNTLPAGNPAQVGLNLVGSTLRFSFDLPQGQDGQAGPPFAQAVVDAVNTVDPGQPAAVQVSFDGTNVRFIFDLPRGQEGSAGPSGSDGAPGPPGNDGPQGPPFAQAVVDGVTTLPAGDPASVGVNFDGTNVHFTFAIPQGPSGEVSQAALDAAIAGTSSQSNAVATLGMAVSDPPSQAEVQTIANKLDELLLALRR